MRTALAVMVGAALLAGRAEALERWTWQDTAWEGGAIAALALDWGTTRDLAWRNSHQVRGGRRYAEHEECNPVLGHHPSMQQVNTYFATAIVTHAAIATLLPSRWRRAWQVSALGLEIVAVGSNFQASLSVRF